MNRTTERFSPDRLVHLAQLLPEPVRYDACRGLDLPGYFDYDPSVSLLPFGERLILSSGLLLAAAMVECSTEVGVIDPQITGIMRQLFPNGSYYNTGVAQALLAHLPAAATHLHIDAPNDASCMSKLLDFLRIGRYGNFVRALYQAHERGESLELILADVLNYLAFVRGFSFDPARADIGILNGRDIRLWPFLHWDGQHLWGLRHAREASHVESRKASLPTNLLFVREDRNHSDEFVRDDHDVTAEESVWLADVMRRLGIRVSASDERAPFEPESFIPAMSQTYPHIRSLILLLSKHAGDSRQEWVKQYLAKAAIEPTKSGLARALKDGTTIENAILSACLEKDPIEVLASHFETHRVDQKLYLRTLARDRCDAILDQVEHDAKLVRVKHNLLRTASDEDLERSIAAYRARLVAIEVAQLLGFRIKNVVVRESIEEYIGRLTDFIIAIEARTDAKRPLYGLRDAFFVCERVLAFVELFHCAAEHFTMDAPHGFSSDGQRALKSCAAKRRMFGARIVEFQRLLERYDRDGIGNLGQRPGIPKEAMPHLAALGTLRNWRNEQQHPEENFIPPPMRARDAIHLLKSILRFFEWLQKPVKNRQGSSERLYPAILHLNVLTTNRCGLTTVTYVLHGKRQDDTIRLYTRQPVSGAAGVFYGLPVLGNATAELWVDPVLFAADVFENCMPHSESGS